MPVVRKLTVVTFVLVTFVLVTIASVSPRAAPVLDYISSRPASSPSSWKSA